jgi:hypothetical protein
MDTAGSQPELPGEGAEEEDERPPPHRVISLESKHDDGRPHAPGAAGTVPEPGRRHGRMTGITQRLPQFRHDEPPHRFALPGAENREMRDNATQSGPSGSGFGPEVESKTTLMGPVLRQGSCSVYLPCLCGLTGELRHEVEII